MSKYEVGQRVWVHETYGRGPRPPKEAKITKVGRKLVHVSEPNGWRDSVYRMDTGHINDHYGHSFIRTDEEETDAQRRVAPIKYLRSWRLYDLKTDLGEEES